LEALIREEFDLFSAVFNINDHGYWEEGRYVLIQKQPLNEIGFLLGVGEDYLAEKKKEWERILYLDRSKRSKPRLDDKCITSWNALMLRGYTDAYKALGEKNIWT